MTRQKRHIRHSKRGIPFAAGGRGSKYVVGKQFGRKKYVVARYGGGAMTRPLSYREALRSKRVGDANAPYVRTIVRKIRVNEIR